MNVIGLAKTAAAALAPATRQVAGSAAGASGGFADALRGALGDAVNGMRAAEGQATAAVAGKADLTDAVSAVTKAELTLQAAMAIRDRAVQAYQDIQRMPI